MTSPTHIAIIEDSAEILSLLSDALINAGYEVSTYSRAADFEESLSSGTPSLCIVDLGLPDKDGLSLVSHIASETDASILVVSGRAALDDRITGLELGADDYLAKPFEISEVVARVRALIRRRIPAPQSVETKTEYEFSGWTANLSAFTLAHKDGETKRLSASEAALLSVFLNHANQLITREQMQVALDDRSDSLAFDRTIDVRVSRLRAKLNDSTRNPKIIKTIYGAGYIFILD